MKLKYPLKEHWEGFKLNHRHPDTIAHIESILGEEITYSAFFIAHRRMCHSKHGKKDCTNNLWKFLTENNWIKKG